MSRMGSQVLLWEAFSSLGSGGIYEANQERDMHRWLNQLYGVQLTTYKVTMHLTAPRCECFKYVFNCIVCS